MERPVKRTRDADSWQRRSEGFTDLFTNKASSNKPSQRNSTEYKKQATLTHGNIFEKLAFPSKETSQTIAWSSSENEEDKPCIQPRNKRNKISPRTVSNVYRKTRSSLTQHHKGTVHIVASSDSDQEDADRGSQHSSTAVTSSTKTDAVSIKGYESDQDVKEVYPREKTPSPSPEADSLSSISISAASSQPGPSGGGLKASDWVKSLQLKTPSKTQHTSKQADVEDSAKKKKKHPKGGLAEQLSRLQKRDQSSIRVWKHQHTAVSTSQDARSVFMEITGFDSLYSLQLLRCKMVPLIAGPTTDPSSHIDRLVMIPASQAEQLKLQPGMQIQIYPPWQQLELSTGEEIMLCTKYCHVIDHPEGGVTVTPPQQYVQPSIQAKWNCPCAQGLCTSESLCPAYQFPCIPGYIQDNEAPCDIKAQETDRNSNTVKAATGLAASTTTNISLTRPLTTHLHTVGLTAYGSNMKSPSSNSNGSTVFDSILESIENDRSKGENHGSCLCFKGHVHKKTQINEEGSLVSYHLFVEDVFGTVCLIQLTSRSLHFLDIDEEHIEGKTFQFSGLKVHERITRDRDPVLLSMVDRVWSGTLTNKVNSQDTQEHNHEAIGGDLRVDFCYILKESLDSSLCILPCLVDLYEEKEVMLHSLSDLIKPHHTCIRCDCIVRIVYLHYDEKKKQELKSAFVIDRTRTVPLCMKFESTKKHCKLVIRTAEKACKLIKDLCLLNGEVVVDDYTDIPNSSDKDRTGQFGPILNTLHNLKVVPKPINKQSCVSDIIFVKGVICEVDEDSAYSWEVCKSCGSDQIQMDLTTGISKCNDCKKTNLDTGVRMKMEVIVKVINTDIKVKIDLLQSTIECLLPKDEEDEDGYELSSVLNKHLGPLNCLITARGQLGTFSLKEIELLN